MRHTFSRSRSPRAVKRRPGAPRVAVTAIFFINGAALSSLYARLPALQAELRLDDATLGALLLATAVGLLLAQPTAAALAARTGSAPVTRTSALALAAALPLPALAPTPLTLGTALAALGACNGALDVAMNAQGIAVERRSSRRVYASFHAALSLGAVAGAAVAGAVAALGASPTLHLSALGIVLAGAAYAASRRLLPADLDAAPQGPSLAAPSRALAALGLVAFCCLLAEGAVFDWSAVYLRRTLEASEVTAAAGLAAFSLTMGLGRLTGDRLAGRLGPVALARGGAALAGASFALALLAATPPAAIAGFALLGAGLAAVFPLALAAAAARSPQAAAAPAIAAVSTAGYLGLVCGPPTIGLLSGLVGLVAALGVLVALCGVVVLLAHHVR
jgi:predicted MFS family arabinose efflux permease